MKEMMSESFIQKVKADKELLELQRKIYSITGDMNDIIYPLPKCPDLETWKNGLREKLKVLEAQNGGI